GGTMKGKISAWSLVTLLTLLLALVTQVVKLQAGQAEWKVFSSKEGGFSVLMPGVPQEEVKQDLGKGEAPPIEIHLFTAKDESGFYLASYTEITGLARANQEYATAVGTGFLRTVNQDTARFMKGKVVKETDISIGAYPGKETLIELPG